MVKAQTLSASQLLSAVIKRERSVLVQKPKQYIIVTNLTVRFGTYLKPIRINDVMIRFKDALPPRFDRSDQLVNAQRRGVAACPDHCAFVQMSVKGRNESEAMTKGMRALEILRGIWNLSQNYPHENVYLTNLFSPINRILAGPVYTIHSVAGESSGSDLWYERNYPRNNVEVVDLSNSWDDIKTLKRKIFTKLSKQVDKNTVFDFICEYVSAMDRPDMTEAFVALWRCLERLTFTGKKDSHSETVRRASFIFKESDYHRDILDQMRFIRNEVVHHGKDEPQIKVCVEELRFIVESMLRFHIFNRLGLKDKESVINLLSLSASAELLKSAIELQKKALRFRES